MWIRGSYCASYEAGRGGQRGPPTPVASGSFGAARPPTPVTMQHNLYNMPLQSPTSRGFMPPGFFPSPSVTVPFGFSPAGQRVYRCVLLFTFLCLLCKVNLVRGRVPTFLGGNVVHLVTFPTPMIWNQKSMLGFRHAALAVSQSLDRVLYAWGSVCVLNVIDSQMRRYLSGCQYNR